MRFRNSTSGVTSDTEEKVYIYFVGMAMRYSQINDAPILSNVLLNNQSNITAMDTVYATASVSDTQGCLSLKTSSPTYACVYRSGVANSNCASLEDAGSGTQISCTINDCSGEGDTTATVSCAFNSGLTSDPTDTGTP